MSEVYFTPHGMPAPPVVERIVRTEIEATLQRVTHLAHAEVLMRMARHRRTGHLMRGTLSRVTMLGRMSGIGQVGTNVFYAPFLEKGTGLYGPKNHWIYPKNGSFLRWPDHGSGGFTLAGRQRRGRAGANARWIYARRVRGIRPLRFFRDSALVVAPKAELEFAAGAERITAALRMAMP